MYFLPLFYKVVSVNSNLNDKYSRTSFIGINWDAKPSGYAENLDTGFFF